MVLLGLLICIVCVIFNLFIYKDVTVPPIILSLLWTFIHGVLLIGNISIENNVYYLVFSGSLILFSLGFYFVFKVSGYLWVKKEVLNYNLGLNKSMLIVILIAITLLVSLNVAEISKYIFSNYQNNVWQTIEYGKGTGLYQEFFLFGYMRNFMVALSLVLFYLYLKGGFTKFYKLSFFYIFILTAFMVLTAGNRSIMFLFIIAMFFQFIFVKNYSNIKKIAILFMVFLSIMTVFLGFTILKFVYDDQSNIFSFLMKYIEIYFSYSLIAFVTWYESFNEYLYGGNTFKFIFTVLNILGFNLQIENNIQEYVEIGEYTTNVYTMLEYYTQDFGLIYALIVISLFGASYGYLYRVMKSRVNNVVSSSILCLLYYPLIYQFFGDQYFSIASTWIQLIFWIIILNKFMLVRVVMKNES